MKDWFILFADNLEGLHLCSLWILMMLLKLNGAWTGKYLVGERYRLLWLQRQGKSLRKCAIKLGSGLLGTLVVFLSHSFTHTRAYACTHMAHVVFCYFTCIYVRIYLACNSPEDHQAMGDDHLIMVCGLQGHILLSLPCVWTLEDPRCGRYWCKLTLSRLICFRAFSVSFTIPYALSSLSFEF